MSLCTAKRTGTSAGINCISLPLRTAERAFWDRTRRRNSETRPNASPGPNLEGVKRDIYGTHAPRSHRASDLGLRVYNACKVFWVYTMPASFAQTLWLLSSICSCCFLFCSLLLQVREIIKFRPPPPKRGCGHCPRMWVSQQQPLSTTPS